MSQDTEYVRGPGAEAYSTTAIIKRCVRAAETADLIDELSRRGYVSFKEDYSDNPIPNHTTNEMLIGELKRRGILRDVSVSHVYYSEMAQDDGYMRAIEKAITADAAKLVASVLDLSDSEPSDQELASGLRTRNGTLSLLVDSEKVQTLTAAIVNYIPTDTPSFDLTRLPD